LNLNLSTSQAALLDFVKEQHGDQQRKYSDEPYWHHLVRVAETAARYLDAGIEKEIALCHDLLEDTPCTEQQLHRKLVEIGYPKQQADSITRGVVELTDVFIKPDFPDLNRKARKKREARRLGDISPLAQSIKYADLIDNTASITDGDNGFARVYLREAVDILDQMREGNIRLFIECCHAILEAEKQL
jgi:guanosine-3',5'-bis(diphosphate) 3'-pyrophosphohydrolase